MAANETQLALNSVYNNYEDLQEVLHEYQKQNFAQFNMHWSRTDKLSTSMYMVTGHLTYETHFS